MHHLIHAIHCMCASALYVQRRPLGLLPLLPPQVTYNSLCTCGLDLLQLSL